VNIKYLIPFIFVIFTSCSVEQVDDAFTLSMPEYDVKWNPQLRWTIEDIQVYANIEIEEQEARNEITDTRFSNGPCLLSAERKYELAIQNGFNESDLEIVVIKLTEDAAIKLDWSKGWPTHAVLRYKDEIFDNGFISDIPFYIEDLPRYGVKVKDVWSRYQK